MVTGTSVLGIKFEGGVMLAADTLGSYGSMARFRSLSRLSAVGDSTAIGGSGDMSDFQYISSDLQELVYIFFFFFSFYFFLETKIIVLMMTLNFIHQKFIII